MPQFRMLRNHKDIDLASAPPVASVSKAVVLNLWATAIGKHTFLMVLGSHKQAFISLLLYNCRSATEQCLGS